MDAVSLQGEFISKIPYPLSKSAKLLKKCCSTQIPNVVFIKKDEYLAVAKVGRLHEVTQNQIVKKVLPSNFYADMIGHDDNLLIFKYVRPFSDEIKTFKDA